MRTTLILLGDTPDLVQNWLVLAPLVAGALAIWYLLPTPSRRPVAGGALVGLLALGGLGAFLFQGLGHDYPQTVEGVLFAGFAGMAILFAVLMITNRNPARAALSFAMTVLSTCGLFLLMGAPFLSAATVIIYAGAIIVTFLFVIMLAHQEGPSNADQRSREPALAVASGFVLLATLLVGLQRVYDHQSIAAVIKEAETLATTERIDALYYSSADPTALKQPDDVQLSGKAQRFVAAAKAALERVTMGTPRASDDRRLTDHRLAQQVANSINGLETSGFKLNDADIIRESCQQIASGLTELQAIRTRAMKPDDVVLNDTTKSGAVVLSPYGEVQTIGNGPKQLPAANVAALGRVLFADHLLAIELAGTLLLIATVGAIAIAGGRKEKAK